MQLPDELLKKTSVALYSAGLDIVQIARVLKVKTSKIRDFVPSNIEKNPNELNQQLVDEILYDANMPIAKEAIVKIEKTRYQYYADLEESCLRVMTNLLNHYEAIPEGDSKTDQFKAQLAASFIKATQSAREEVLRKYEIDVKKDSAFKIEIIGPTEDVNEDKSKE